MQAQRRIVGGEADHRQGRLLRRGLIPEIRCAGIAAAIIGIAEMQTRPGGMVEFFRWQVVAHVIGAVVGEVEALGDRVESQADGITDAAGEDFGPQGADRLASPGRADPDDGAFHALDTADVARRSDRHIQPAVGTEGGVPPAVPAVVRQPPEQHLRTAGRQFLEAAGPETDHPVLFGHIEVAVSPGDAVGNLKPGQHPHHFFRLVVPVGVDDGEDTVAAGSDEDHAQGRGDAQRPGAGNLGVRGDGESRRQGQALQVGIGSAAGGGGGGKQSRQDERPQTVHLLLLHG